MKIIFVFLAILASILATMLIGLLIYNLEIMSIIAGLTFGLVVFYFSKKSSQAKKVIQFTFLVTAIVLAIVAYKFIFDKNDMVNTETLQITKSRF
ncbi:FUSC family protein [Flavivirga rizhaonensis]|uniref:FUSC family protein n=1 Tax=Flavivirga rizhaonensis TaxID=2559571 RepID=A0A4S1DUC3_9FLAO|nr:FUSC family protein [Flavivirga rizhaonensis]TGV01656.1 FUSC family protein [Flavivirga rizhaonensis]